MINIFIYLESAETVQSHLLILNQSNLEKPRAFSFSIGKGNFVCLKVLSYHYINNCNRTIF